MVIFFCDEGRKLVEDIWGGDTLKLKDIFLTVIIIILGWQVLRLNEELFSLGEITPMTMSGVFFFNPYFFLLGYK